MKKILILIVLGIALTFQFSAAQTSKEVIYFDYAKFVLKAPEEQKLNNWFNQLNKDKLASITLIGHTDTDGSNSYNIELSDQRVMTISTYLVSKGISKDKIHIESYGEDKPIASNDNEDGKQQNRSVEILVNSNSKTTESPVISSIYSRFKPENQIFLVPANEDVAINGTQGTIIRIPKNSFVGKNGSVVTGTVTIELKEFYKKSDALMADLHTMSGKDLLVSGGMINITAACSKEELTLKKGSEIEIEFAGKKIDGMKTFSGQEQNGQINWVQQNPSSESAPVSISGKVGTRKDIRSDQGDYSDIRGNSYIMDTTTVREYNAMDKMILKSSGLGWINCDHFYNSKNKTDLIVNVDTTLLPMVRLVFKNINAIMPAYLKKDGKMVLNNIPVGQKVTLIAFSVVNYVPWFVSKDILVSPNQTENLVLVQTNMDELKKNLKKLD